MRSGGLGEEERAFDVDCHDFVVLCFGELVEFTKWHDSCACYDNV